MMSEDSYFGGSEMQAMARLIAIAEVRCQHYSKQCRNLAASYSFSLQMLLLARLCWGLLAEVQQ